MKKISKYIISGLILSVFFAQVNPVQALDQDGVRERISNIISELISVLMQVKSGDYCTGYTGGSSIVSVQWALFDLGFDIGDVDGKPGAKTTAAIEAFQASVNIKVDGKVGPQTRAALSAAVPRCPDIDLVVAGKSLFAPVTVETAATQAEPIAETKTPTSETAAAPSTAEPVESTNSQTVQSDLVSSLQDGEIIASVRSTSSGVPDDTAVFTFQLSLNNTETFYIPISPSYAFSVDVFNSTTGMKTKATGVNSIVSSGATVSAASGTSYFALEADDTISLRVSIQPGDGDYHAQLSRLSYTTDDVTKNSAPQSKNYEFNAQSWKSEMVTLLN